MASWNKHGGPSGTGGPPNVSSGIGGAGAKNIIGPGGNNMQRRGPPRPTSSGEDGEIGEEEGEIISSGGGAGGTGAIFNNSNRNTGGGTSPNPMVPRGGGHDSSMGSHGGDRQPPFMRGGGGVPRRNGPPWANRGRGGPPMFGQRSLGRAPIGNRTFSGPPTIQQQSSSSQQSSQQQQPPVTISKPESLSRSQTFSGFASSSLSSSSNRPINSSNTNLAQPQQQHQYSTSSGVGGPLGIKGGSTSGLTAIARPTDPRFRGNDLTSGSSSGNRLSTIQEVSSSTTATLPSRGIHHHTQQQQQQSLQQQSSISPYQSAKDSVANVSSSRESYIRRDVPSSRVTYNTLADPNDPLESHRPSHSDSLSRREQSSYSRSNDAEHSGGLSDGPAFVSPRRGSSRIPSSDSFARDDDPPTVPSSSSRSQLGRSDSTAFRGIVAESDSVFGSRSRPLTPSTSRELYRSESLGQHEREGYSSYSSRPPPRDPPFRSSLSSSTDTDRKDYTGIDSKGGGTSSIGYGLSSRGALTSQRDTFRGPTSRRSSDFGSSRGYGNDDTPFRSSTLGGSTNEGSSLRSSSSNDINDSYYSSVGGGSSSDFRRSPMQRRSTFSMGREGGGLPLPPLGRSGSFSHRRSDPRFVPANSNFEPDNSLSTNEGTSASSSNEESKQQSFAKLAEGDPFGRTREWSTNSSRRSPQSSPMNRRISLSYTHNTSPSERSKITAPMLAMVSQAATNVPLVNDYSSMSTASLPSAPVAPVQVPPKEINQDEEKHQLVPQPPQEETPPPPLFTSALGENNIKRGELVIGEVVELLECFELKPTMAGELSKLPTKKQILEAVALMDTKLKESQKRVDDKKLEVETATKEEEEIRLKAKEEAISEAKRQEEQRLRRDEEIRSKEENELAKEIETLTSQLMNELEKEKKQILNELEEKLCVSKDHEEQKLKENLNQQMLEAADNFDKDIGKIKRDIDKTKQNASKTEAKLTNAEADYKAKMEDVDRSGNGENGLRTDDLIAKILAENRRRAAEAHAFHFAVDPENEDESMNEDIQDELENLTDPKENRTMADWALLAQQVSGPENALYSEPAQAPYFKLNEKTHTILEPIVAEYVRDKETRLKDHWIMLAEEYEYRRVAFEKALPVREKKTAKSSNLIERYSIFGAKPSQPVLESSGGRTSANPYRRARRGNEVRSESELEQVIAEIAEKEALQKRITCGGCEVPRQRTNFEKKLTVNYINTFIAQKVDMLKQEEELASTNVWTDMEKCIFLDRFMQHPKDFRKIASFLRNKTTADCVRFYYDSKQSVPYKHALREHIMRRKRRGDYHVWDATIEAAISVGARIEAGVSEDKPLVFLLPESDHTYYTNSLHPIKRDMFDEIDTNDNSLANYDETVSDDDEPKRNCRSRKRSREPLFVLDSAQRKFLKSQESSPPIPFKKAAARSTETETEQPEPLIPSSGNTGNNNSLIHESEPKEETGMTPARKAPQKWTTEEKKIFFDTLEKHGRNWAMLSQAVGTKAISQIKNFYYDYQKQGKGRIEKRSKREEQDIGKYKIGSRSRDEDTSSPPPPSSRASSPPETPIRESIIMAEARERRKPMSSDATVVASNTKASAQEARRTTTQPKNIEQANVLVPQEARAVESNIADQQIVDQASSEQSANDKKGTAPRIVEPREAEYWAVDQRGPVEQKAADQKVVGKRVAEQKAIEGRSNDYKSTDQRASDERTSALPSSERVRAEARFSEQDQRILEQRAIERRAMELRLLEQRIIEQRGDQKLNAQSSRDNPGYGWPVPSSANQTEPSERKMSTTGATADNLPLAGDVWNQALLHTHKMNEDTATRRLLQQHQNQSQHHQQFLSSLLPWMSGGQQPAGVIHDYGRYPQHQQNPQRPHHLQPVHPQHMQQQQVMQQQQHLHPQQHQNLHQQLQQRQVQSQQLHQIRPQGGQTQNPPYHIQQQAQHQHHQTQHQPQQQPQQHHQQQQQQLEHPLVQRSVPQQNAIPNVGNPSLSTLLAALSQQTRNPSEDPRLALAHRLLELQGGVPGNDPLGLLSRSLPNSGNNPNNFHGQGNQGNR